MRVLIALVVVAVWVVSPTNGQSPVYVDDSPRAWELFQRAGDQIADNASEAVRLYQELLDDYGDRLIPVDDHREDQFMSVRQRVMQQLLDHEHLLTRYRLIESAAAQRLLEQDALVRLAQTRALTPAGLEAMLRLGQAEFEAGRFRAALYWLREAAGHADLDDTRAAHRWHLVGLIGCYLPQDALRDQAQQALKAVSSDLADSFAAHIQTIAGQTLTSNLVSGTNTLDVTEAPALESLVDEPIWSMALEETLAHRRFDSANDGVMNPAFDQATRTGELMTVMPTVAGGAVYVNEGHVIRAIDRFANRELWTPYRDNISTRAGQVSDPVLDMNFIAIHGDALVAITGHAFATNRNYPNARQIVCLDRTNGRRRWVQRISGIGDIDDHDGLYPFGAPIISEGRVIVTARKVSPQAVASCYVMALSLDTGDLLWSTHVASSGGINQRGRPLTLMSHQAGAIYLTSALGAAARLSATTGEIDWLHRFPVHVTTRTDRAPWEVGMGVMTRVGYLALAPDLSRVLLFDPNTGDVVAQYACGPDDTWGWPRYFLADEQHVYAVSERSISAFSLDAMDAPIWQLKELPEHPFSEGFDDERTRRLVFRGRVQLTEAALVVPATEGIVVIDSETGQLQHSVDVSRVGNPLAVDGQLLIASPEAIDAYMPFDRAERMLRSRIAQRANDPEAALSLLHLGVRGRNLDLALEAAAMARTAIAEVPLSDMEQAAIAQQQLFDMLLELHGSPALSGHDRGQSFYGILGSIAQTPPQRIDHLLAFGDWLSQHNLGQSIETYQTILSDDELAETFRLHNGVDVPAAVAARQRIGQLIDEHGIDVYGPQATFAAQRLRELAQRNDIDGMMTLVREFPLAEAATEAAMQVAAQLGEVGQQIEAIAALMTASRVCTAPEARKRLLAALADRYVQIGWKQTAADLIELVIMTYGDCELASSGSTRMASDWLAELTEQPFRQPRVGRKHAGDERWLRGHLMPLASHSIMALPHDRFLSNEHGEMAMYEASSLQQQWSLFIEDEFAEVLHFSEDELLVWLPTPGDPRVMRVDPETGNEIWMTRRMPEGDVAENLGQARGPMQLPDGTTFETSGAIVLPGQDQIVIVRRTGSIASFDRQDGTTLRWSVPRIVKHVYYAAYHELGLVIAGVDEPLTNTRQQLGRLIILDPESGEEISRHTFSDDTDVRWLKVSPTAELIFATENDINALDLRSGEYLWSTGIHEVRGTSRGWLAGGACIIEDADERLRSVNLLDGRTSEAFDLPLTGQWTPDELVSVEIHRDRILALYRERLVRYALDGVIEGAEVVADRNRRYQAVVSAGEHMFLLNHTDSSQVVQPDGGRRTEHTYQMYVLSPSCKLLDRPYEIDNQPAQLQEARLVDGNLLLSSHSAILALPLPAYSESD